MSSSKWFVAVDGQVRGPFAEEAVEAMVAGSANSLVWGRGLDEWLPPQRWRQSRQERTVHLQSGESSTEREWRVATAGQEQPPMSYAQMLLFLRKQTNLQDVLVWTEGYSEWREVFQIHRIMDELGVSRRAHPRVPITGSLQCEGATGSFEAKLQSISEGGVGAMNALHVKIGEKYKIHLQSPNLPSPIHASAEVVYVGQDGYGGFRFSALQAENKSMIIDYVKRFTEIQMMPASMGTKT